MLNLNVGAVEKGEGINIPVMSTYIIEFNPYSNLINSCHCSCFISINSFYFEHLLYFKYVLNQNSYFEAEQLPTLKVFLIPS